MSDQDNGDAHSPNSPNSPSGGQNNGSGSIPATGSNGQNGANGANGINTANGQNGLNGHNGANGVNGANGATGATDRTPLPSSRASRSGSPDDYTDIQIRRAAERAREMINGPDVESDRILRWAMGRLCERITSEPDTYIMTNCERSVYTLFQHEFVGNEVARRAVARYWDNPPPRTPPQDDDASSPEILSPGAQERAQEALRVEMAVPELGDHGDSDSDRTPSPPEDDSWSNPNSSRRHARA